jgi:hypothetical protein
MTSNRIALVALLLVAVTLPQSAIAQQEGSWTLDARTVPAPEAVSKELHDAIAAAPKPDARQWRPTRSTASRCSV